MRTVLVGPPPVELERWLDERRARGQDRFDEVWEGEYHVAPSPHLRHGLVHAQLFELLRPAARRAGLRASGSCNIGGPDDYRVPDQAYFHRDVKPAVWNPTAVIVVEIVSPGDESRDKFGFYHHAGVEEVLIVDPQIRTVEWFDRSRKEFEPAEGSRNLGLSSEELEAMIDWPS
jgi:Uma2 family endonuclease